MKKSVKPYSVCISCVWPNESHRNTNTKQSLPSVNVNIMASSDSASISIPPQTTLKKNSAQHGSPRHLNIMSDFHTWFFRFVYNLNLFYSSKMVI